MGKQTELNWTVIDWWYPPQRPNVFMKNSLKQLGDVYCLKETINQFLWTDAYLLPINNPVVTSTSRQKHTVYSLRTSHFGLDNGWLLWQNCGHKNWSGLRFALLYNESLTNYWISHTLQALATAGTIIQRRRFLCYSSCANHGVPNRALQKIARGYLPDYVLKVQIDFADCRRVRFGLVLCFAGVWPRNF